jgi:hypothetical protein
VNIDQVKVGPRFRKDLGPIEDLAESISEVGLIQPIIVDQDGNLIAGRRRLAACKLLGWSDIPVVVAEGLRDAADRVQAERDENTCRKNMTASELVAIGLALEELERPKARARQVLAGERFGRGTDSSGSREPELSGRTSGVVGPALGMSRVTYERAKSVVLASQDAEAPGSRLGGGPRRARSTR